MRVSFESIKDRNGIVATPLPEKLRGASGSTKSLCLLLELLRWKMLLDDDGVTELELTLGPSVEESKMELDET